MPRAIAAPIPWQVYRHITIPLLWPGIFSAAIFAFLLSWGNFYLTYSLAGSARTLPTFIFSGIAIGSSPLYPAIATVVFIPGILLVILANRLRRTYYSLQNKDLTRIHLALLQRTCYEESMIQVSAAAVQPIVDGIAGEGAALLGRGGVEENHGGVGWRGQGAE